MLLVRFLFIRIYSAATSAFDTNENKQMKKNIAKRQQQKQNIYENIYEKIY